jgi:hypothetical protein
LKNLEIYNSVLLDKRFKPNPNAVELSPELESLKPLIASQHKAFLQPIKDLGYTCLTITKLIEKKKDSLHQLQNNDKIPRSLRLKCTLTTSPAYKDNDVFLQQKEKLKNEVNLFIKKGTEIMTDWAVTNIQLLEVDRCLNSFIKALQILDGITSYVTEIIGTPSWPSVPMKYTSLFLLKLYFSNSIIDVSELTSFFNLPSTQIVHISTKIMLNTNSDEEATVLLDKLLLSDVDMNDELQNIVIREIFSNFDQILRFTTINLWLHYQEKDKQATAAFNLESKMTALESANASELTAIAIAKATEKIDNDHSLNVNTSLRLSNLEKAVRRQEQKSNETRNSNKRAKTQKNSRGGYTLEQIATPDRSAPLLNKTPIVDLTLTQDKPGTENTQRIEDKQRLPTTRTKNMTFLESGFLPQMTTAVLGLNSNRHLTTGVI